MFILYVRITKATLVLLSRIYLVQVARHSLVTVFLPVSSKSYAAAASRKAANMWLPDTYILLVYALWGNM